MGANSRKIIEAVKKCGDRMTSKINPYGAGNASKLILEIIASR